MMAPTELLARQHKATMEQFLSGLNIPVELLISALPAKEKRRVVDRAASGAPLVLCGTHALIQNDVALPNAALIVVDEQHRFGVDQRAALNQKTDRGHLLAMSATPIPRTLTLILYGDLDVSILDELPPGRQPVMTRMVSEAKRQDMYGFLQKEIDAGGQAYIVCPLVEEGEEASDKKAATAYIDQLQQILPRLRIGLMHGKLKPAEKEAVMAAFAAGDLDVLVSTTVIEVGVDVPRATLMIVENADFFGLSQLHQLRGRVGRGKRQSYCFLMHQAKTETARERLQTLCATNDGFKIAETDLRLRGPGDFFGRRQSGLPGFAIADLATDMNVLEAAQQSAQALLKTDPHLESAPLLALRVQEVIQKTLSSSMN
jgi:ATP-dependent DNA helicase RecG